MFLATDAILNLYTVASGLVVNAPVVRKNLDEELPFLASENILMAAAKRAATGRTSTRRSASSRRRRATDEERGRRERPPRPHRGGSGLRPDAGGDPGRLDPARFIGRAPEQVDEFLEKEIDPILATAPQAAAGETHEEVRV